MRSSHSLDRVDVVFDDDHQVANAGLILPATLAQHLGIKELADEVIKLGPGPGAALPGRKVMTVLHGILAGADSIDDLDVLRAGATQKVLGHAVMAPSTIGTFLRAFTFGHVRQLDRLTELVLAGAWAAGAGPGDAPMTIDIDSTINGVHGKQKQGASYGYTKKLGYHPLLATRAETGEVLHVRFRGGRTNTGRGAPRFIDELVGRVRRAGATGQLTLRADSGFWSKKVIKACRKHGVRYSITARNTKPIKRAIGGIADDVWVRIPYPQSGIAEVAEVAHDGARLIVRRVRNPDDQGELFPDWRYHAFITGRPPQPRRDRTRHPGPQRRRGLEPLPVGTVQRQRRLARHRQPRPQSPPLDRPHRPGRPRAGRRQDPPLPLPQPPRAHHPLRSTPNTPPPPELALENTVLGRAQPSPSWPRRRLNPADPDETTPAQRSPASACD